MEPIEYARALRRRAGIIIVVVAMGLIAAWLTTPSGRKSSHSLRAYGATHTLLLQDQSSATSLDQLALLVKKGEVPRRVAKKLNYPGPPAELAQQVDATADATTQTVNVRVILEDPQRAKLLADTFATELINSLNSTKREQYQRSLQDLNNQVNKLQSDARALEPQIAAAAPPDKEPLRAQQAAIYSQLTAAYQQQRDLATTGSRGVNLVSLEFATPLPITGKTAFAVPANRAIRLLIGGAVALLLGCGLALVLERLDTRIRTKDDAEAAFSYPVIAEVPRLPRRELRRREIVVAERPASPAAEAYRNLRTALLLRNNEPRVVLVVSPSASEGKTTTAVNLAATLAETGKNLVVLSWDLRTPTVETYLRPLPAWGTDLTLAGETLRGLGECLAGEQPASLMDVVQPTAVEGVAIVTAGRPVHSPGELVTRAGRVIAQARNLADIVVIDTGPLLVSSDARALTPFADSIVLVCRSGKTSIENARRATQLEGQLGASVQGVVLVGAPRVGGRSEDYYYPRSARRARLLGRRRDRARA